jgi:hypothetical protein
VARSGLILLALCLAVGAAACGGGGGSSEKPAQGASTGESILKKAGLEACSKHTVTGAAYVGSGLQQSQELVVAPSCATKPAVPTTVTALTYSTQDAASQAATAARKAQPKAEVFIPTVAPYTTTVLVVSGPKASEYAADIKQALPKGS